MKILYIVGEFPSVSETFVLNQITGLIDKGHSVTIFAQEPKEFSKMHQDIEKYQLIDKTIYYKAPLKYKDRLIYSINSIIKYGIKFPTKIMASLNVFKYGKQVLTWKYLLTQIPLLGKKAMEYDVIHCHFGDNGLIGQYLKDQGFISGEIYTTFHGYDMTTLIKKRGNELYQNLFENGYRMLPISHFWKQKLLDLGCDEEKIIVHPMGVDMSKFEFIPKVPEKHGEILIVSTARLVEKKGIEYAIHAVARLISDGFNVKYKIVGDGPLKTKLKNLVLDYGIEDSIILTGWKTQEETIRYLKEAHIFLAPSVISRHGDMEGIPVAIMEAMAMGKIVVSTFHSGIPELINDGQEGFLVNERDIDELYNKLCQVIQNNNLEKVEREARQKIEKYHNIHQLNSRLELMFKNKY